MTTDGRSEYYMTGPNGEIRMTITYASQEQRDVVLATGMTDVRSRRDVLAPRDS